MAEITLGLVRKEAGPWAWALSEPGTLTAGTLPADQGTGLPVLDEVLRHFGGVREAEQRVGVSVEAGTGDLLADRAVDLLHAELGFLGIDIDDPVYLSRKDIISALETRRPRSRASQVGVGLVAAAQDRVSAMVGSEAEALAVLLVRPPASVWGRTGLKFIRRTLSRMRESPGSTRCVIQPSFPVNNWVGPQPAPKALARLIIEFLGIDVLESALKGILDGSSDE
jgi:hypothetical protein